jgi:hypothetical protein
MCGHGSTRVDTMMDEQNSSLLRSRDGKNLKSSRNIQVSGAFGDRPAKWNGTAVTHKL